MRGCVLASVYVDQAPLILLTAVSLAAGVLMLLVFRYTSDQEKIRRAKDQVQAQLLAVRLFQDQLSAVMLAYGRLVRGTVRYIGVMLKPTLILVLIFAPVIVLLDPYFGWEPLRPQQPFLMKVVVAEPNSLDGVSLELPAGIVSSAPPVRIPSEQEIVWRLVAEKNGTYPVRIVANRELIWKPVVVSAGLVRVSASSWRRDSWQRWSEPGAATLPTGAPVRSIVVGYDPREINVGFFQTNWIIVFFVICIAAALLFKKALHVEI